MKTVQILGTGCSKCAQLQAKAEEAIKRLGIAASVEKIDNVSRIAEFGVFMTPALAVDGQVKSQGKIPSVQDIEAMLG